MKIIQSGNVSIKIRNKKNIKRVKILLNDEEVGFLRQHRTEEYISFFVHENAYNFMDDLVKVVREFSLYSGKSVFFGNLYTNFRIVENVHVSIDGKDHYLPFTEAEIQAMHNGNGKPITIINTLEVSKYQKNEVFLYGNTPYVIKTPFKFNTEIFIAQNKDNICDLRKDTVVITTGKGLKCGSNNKINFKNSDIDELGEKKTHNGQNMSTLIFPKLSIDGCERYRRGGGYVTISFDKNLIPDLNSFRSLIDDIKSSDYPLNFFFEVPDFLFYVWNLLNEDYDCYLHNEEKEDNFRREYIYEDVSESPVDYVKRIIGKKDIGEYVDTMIEIHNILCEYYKGSSRFSYENAYDKIKKSLDEYQVYKASDEFLNLFR